MLQVLGPISVTTPGTPVRATQNVATIDAGGVTNDPTKFSCHAALFQAKKGNVGAVYVGLATLNKTTLAGVCGQLAIPTDNSIPAFSIALTLSPAGVDLSDLWIDADQAGDGVILTVLVT